MTKKLVSRLFRFVGSNEWTPHCPEALEDEANPDALDEDDEDPNEIAEDDEDPNEIVEDDE